MIEITITLHGFIAFTAITYFFGAAVGFVCGYLKWGS
jgi:hypothetical protein